MKRRILSAVLIGMILMGNMSTVFASTLNSGQSASGVYKVADGVEVIGKEAFKGNTKITEVILPSSVKVIEEHAFYGASNLKKINLPNGLKSIGLGAFEKSGLEGELIVPGSVEKIDNLAFAGIKKLDRIVLNEGVKEIGVYAFSTDLRELHLPNSLEKIETLYNSLYDYMPRITELKIYVEKGTKVADMVSFYPDVQLIEGKEIPEYKTTNEQRKEDIAKAPVNVVAKPTSQKVTVDGKEVSFRAYNINGNNYFMLRDIAHIFKGSKAQFEVGWDGVKKAINLEPGFKYTGEGVGFNMTSPHIEEKGIKTTSTIYKNGKEINLLGYVIQGSTFFKLRDLGDELGFIVEWDEENQTVVMRSEEPKIEPPKVEEPKKEEPKDEWDPFKDWDPFGTNDIDTSNIKPTTEAEKEEMRKEMLKLVNEARRKEGLQPLVLDSKLTEMANYKAKDMKDSGMYSHDGTYGSFKDLLSMFNIRYNTAGENLARQQFTASQMFEVWWNSPGHRSNMMNPNFRKIGIGLEDKEIETKGYMKLPYDLKQELRDIMIHDEYTGGYKITGYSYWCVQEFTD